MLSNEEIASNKEMMDAAGRMLAVQGWGGSEVVTTDVIVLVAQRGWDGPDVVARVVLLNATDTPDFVTLGMLDAGRFQIEANMRRFAREEFGDDCD